MSRYFQLPPASAPAWRGRASGEVFALAEGRPDKQVALMQATMIAGSPE
jgi:hypothetical protein